MPESNGLREKVFGLEKQVDRLWEHSATKEAMRGIGQDVDDLKKSIEGVRASFGSLMKAILVACVVWALGSAGFLIGVLSLTSGNP